MEARPEAHAERLPFFWKRVHVDVLRPEPDRRVHPNRQRPLPGERPGDTGGAHQGIEERLQRSRSERGPSPREPHIVGVPRDRDLAPPGRHDPARHLRQIQRPIRELILAQLADRSRRVDPEMT